MGNRFSRRRQASADAPAAAHTTQPAAADPSSHQQIHPQRHITLLHFNDVYNIEPAARDPVGGAARMCHMVKSMAAEHPLVVFSGDAFNPSMMSTVTLGAQMPPVLNKIGVHVACMGNHDFDFGTAQLKTLVKRCTFPWLMANVLDAKSKKPYANARATHLVDWNGVKVGFVGLVEEEWLETLGAVDPEEVQYVDFVEEGHRLAKKLKDEGAELLVAITHMRIPNDRKLAAECPEYHLVLGGHDHHYETEFVEPNHTLVVKSGTDFRDLTRIQVLLPEGQGQRPQLSWNRITIDSSVPEDPAVKEIVDGYLEKLASGSGEVIGHSQVELDGRFTTVRAAESNLCNFICDVLRLAANADCVLLNAGSFRSDTVHPAGPLTLGDLSAILPMLDPTVVVEASGEQILAALENGVSLYPKLEGRFPQVSGIRFTFDPAQPPQQRVLPGSVSVAGQPLELLRRYRLCTKAYVAEGRDGYDDLSACRVLVDVEQSVFLPTAVRNHMRSLKVLGMWDPRVKVVRAAGKWLSNLSGRELGASSLGDGDDEDDSEDDEEDPPAHDMRSAPSRQLVSEGCGNGLCVLDDGHFSIKPLLDGRISLVGAGAGAQQG